MKPTTKLTTLAAALSLTTVLVACGGGGGTDIAGIGGSGFVSSGTITGFGSIFVNGVKFETIRSSFDIEGTQGTQDDLAIGMVVKVNGTINPDGVTGTATEIIFDDDLQGPVANFNLAADRLTATFTVMGINVQVDKKTTYFDPDNGGITIDTIDGKMVELSGFFDGTGTLIASRIENKTGSGDDNVELKGVITELIGSSFKLQGITVDTTLTTVLKDLPNNLLANNIQVEVKGIFDGSKIIASEIESEEFEYGDSGEFEMEGFITDFADNQFKINGITVKFNNTTQMEPSTIQLANNLQIEVEGQLVNGVLIATEIKLRGGDIEVSAPITFVDIANNRFEIEPVYGQPIIIQTGTETQFENELQNSYSVQISDLNVGDFVEVEGYQNDENNESSLFASEVKITNPEEIEVQGIINSFTLTTITIMGIDFETTAPPSFESDNSNITSLDDLRDKVNAGESILVKVELSNNNTNVITKIEIED